MKGSELNTKCDFIITNFLEQLLYMQSTFTQEQVHSCGWRLLNLYQVICSCARLATVDKYISVMVYFAFNYHNLLVYCRNFFKGRKRQPCSRNGNSKKMRYELCLHIYIKQKGSLQAKNCILPSTSSRIHPLKHVQENSEK